MPFQCNEMIRGMNLLEFLRWAEQSDDWREGNQPPAHGVLALPPVQRSPVWGPRQVLELWDSVLRGLPLGTLMLAQRAEGKLGRPAYQPIDPP